MEPDEMRDRMSQALEGGLVPSPGLEARVLSALPGAPARPGGRVRPAGWPALPASLVAVVLGLTVIGAFVVWRTGTPDRVPASAPGGITALTLGGLTSPSTGWVIVRGLALGSGAGSATVFRTDDAGATWSSQLTTPIDDLRLRFDARGEHGVAWGIDRSSPGCAGKGTGGPCAQPPDQTLAVYRTEDGGRHWTAMDPFRQVQDATFLDADHGWLLAGSERPDPSAPSGIYRTDDGGRTWRRAGPLDYRSTPAIAGGFGGSNESFAFDDPDTGWFTTWGASATAAHTGVFATHDGGATWTEIALPPLPNQDPAARITANRPVTFADGTGVLLVGLRSTGQLFVSTTADRGAHWTAPRPLFPPGSAQARERVKGESVIAQFLDATHWFVMNQSSQGVGEPGAPPLRLLTTADGGLHWTTHAPAPEIFDLGMVTPDAGWANASQGSRNVLVRTVDGGAHWTVVRTPARPLPLPS